MSRRFFFSAILLSLLSLASCGYSTRSLLPGHIKTIAIQPFKNRIDYTTETQRNTYFPLLEVRITNAVADRFLFDGNLDVENADSADLVLKGELVGYQRDTLRTTDNDDVLEYRISIIVSLELWNRSLNEVVWSEPNFVGETTYFAAGALAKSESTALEDALADLGRRVVERTVEDW